MVDILREEGEAAELPTRRPKRTGFEMPLRKRPRQGERQPADEAKQAATAGEAPSAPPAEEPKHSLEFMLDEDDELDVEFSLHDDVDEPPPTEQEALRAMVAVTPTPMMKRRGRPSKKGHESDEGEDGKEDDVMDFEDDDED